VCFRQVDAIETDSHYQLEVALPGIRKGVGTSATFFLQGMHPISAVTWFSMHLA